VFALLLLAFGMVSLGSILGAWSLPLSVLFLPESLQSQRPTALIALSFALALFITFTHRSNIRRILRREERIFRKLQLWRRLVGRS